MFSEVKERYLLCQDGGFWVNLGPLLYHWADAHTYLPEDELSIEVGPRAEGPYAR